MKRYNVLFAVVALVLASLACQTIMGGGDSGADTPDAGNGDVTATPSTTTDPFSFDGESEFVMPDDASNVVSVAGVTNFQTDLTLDESIAFYRDEFGKLGYTERDLLTVTSDSTFSIVFDGHESGKSVLLQGVDLGDGTTNIAISLQAVP